MIVHNSIPRKSTGNGIAERAIGTVRPLIEIIKRKWNCDRDDPRLLQKVSDVLNGSQNKTIGCSPFEAFFARKWKDIDYNKGILPHDIRKRNEGRDIALHRALRARKRFEVHPSNSNRGREGRRT